MNLSRREILLNPLAVLSNSAETSPMTVDRDQLDKMVSKLFQDFVYTPDQTQFGKREDWRVPERQEDGKYHGDCDDFALLLRQQLMDMGEDSEIIFCMVPTMEGPRGHAVLHYKSYLADCSNLWTFQKSDRPLWTWLKMSSPDLKTWRSLT